MLFRREFVKSVSKPVRGGFCGQMTAFTGYVRRSHPVAAF
jgi:hypothetical protein